MGHDRSRIEHGGHQIVVPFVVRRGRCAFGFRPTPRHDFRWRDFGMVDAAQQRSRFGGKRPLYYAEREVLK